MHALVLLVTLSHLRLRFRRAIRLVARMARVHLGPSLLHAPAFGYVLLERKPGRRQEVASVDQGAHEARVDGVRGDGAERGKVGRVQVEDELRQGVAGADIAEEAVGEAEGADGFEREVGAHLVEDFGREVEKVEFLWWAVF